MCEDAGHSLNMGALSCIVILRSIIWLVYAASGPFIP